jgi:signal transduction histidine kinase
MNVALVSGDEVLSDVCRELLTDLYGTSWRLSTPCGGAIDPSEDFRIWDFSPGGTQLPPDFETETRCKQWFLVDPRDWTTLQSLVGGREINVLWKPVSRASLSAILGDAGGNGENCERERVVNDLRRERDEMLQFVIQANLKLQEGDRERHNLLERSIHDFRAPLTAMSGYCGLLLQEELGPVTPEQRQVIRRMLLSATRLSRICNGTYRLSIPSDASQELRFEKSELRDCVDRALREMTVLLEAKGISVIAEIEPAPDGLAFDKALIDELLINLLDNMCKFTPKGGSIEIRGYPYFWERRTGSTPAPGTLVDRRSFQAKTPNSFRIDVRDSGPPIPAAQIQNLFEECASYCDGVDRSGGGLGLAICRIIVQRHEGRIWAENDPSGAIFCFVLPLTRTDDAGREIQPYLTADSPIGRENQ